MGILRLGITTSVDGFVAGPHDRPGRGLGDHGEALHYWVFGRRWSYDDEPDNAPGVDADPVDRRVMAEGIADAGAILMGRNVFDIADGWGGQAMFGLPSFVVSHSVADDAARRYPGFTFVTEGIHAALAAAKAAAADRPVFLMGGADVAQQYLAAGLVDEIELTVSPVLLGAGRRLFAELPAPIALTRARVLESRWATHTLYRVDSAA